jgi:YD repeat-containing protein
VTTFGYDAADREIARIDALGRITTRVYDDAGRQVATVDPLGAVTTTAYDRVNRPVAVTNPLGCTTTSVTTPSGSRSRRRTRWANAPRSPTTCSTGRSP